MSHALVFRPDMTEVTGFGGEYEQRARAAIEYGAEWLRDHGYIDVFDHATLQNHIMEHEVICAHGKKVRMGDLLTWSQMGLVMDHLRYIAINGWDAYCERMKSPTRLTEGIT